MSNSIFSSIKNNHPYTVSLIIVMIENDVIIHTHIVYTILLYKLHTYISYIERKQSVGGINLFEGKSVLFVDKCSTRTDILPSVALFLRPAPEFVSISLVEQGMIPGARSLCSRAHAQCDRYETLSLRLLRIGVLVRHLHCIPTQWQKAEKKCERREAGGRNIYYAVRESFTRAWFK